MFNNTPPPKSGDSQMCTKYGTAGQAIYDNIIRRMRVACWISKATHTLRIRSNCCFYILVMVARTRLNVTFIPFCLPYNSLTEKYHIFGVFKYRSSKYGRPISFSLSAVLGLHRRKKVRTPKCTKYNTRSIFKNAHSSFV